MAARRIASLGILGALLAAACSGHDKTASMSPVADMQWDESSEEAAPLAGAPVLVAGEQMIWRVTLHGVEIGELAVAVGAPGTMDGRTVTVVRSRVRTTSAAALLSSLQHDVTTFIDMETARPSYHRRELSGGKELSWVEVKLGGDQFDITYRDKHGKEHSERQIMPGGAPPLDSNGLLVALRGWDATPGERATVHVLRETRVWTMQLVVGGHEQVTTALGEYAAIRLDGMSRRLSRDGAIETDMPPRGYSLWVSDDARRLPLIIAAVTDLGDVRMELVHHAVQPEAR